MKLHCCIFAIALLLTLAACAKEPGGETDARLSAESTTLGTAQPAAEPTVPVTEFSGEATPAELMPTPPAAELPQETYPISYSVVDDENWEPINKDTGFYLYTAAENPVVFGDLFALTLPESWVGKVRICATDDGDGSYIRVMVYSISYAEALHAIRPEIEGSEYLIDPVMDLFIKPKTVDGASTLSPETAPTLETDKWSLAVVSREARDRDCYADLIEVNLYIEQYGQDAYEEALGDIVCTQEEAEAMVSLVP